MTTITQLSPALDDFHGELIRPDDERYDAARALHNGLFDRRPALIARCADAGDVIAALRHARGQGLAVAVRGGAHNAGGLASVDDGARASTCPPCAPCASTRPTAPSRPGRRAAGRRRPRDARVRARGAVRHHLHHRRRRPHARRRHRPSHAQVRPDHRQPRRRRRRPRRRQRRARRARSSTPICSGRSAAAAATSASSPRSSSARIRSHTVCAGPMLWPPERADEIMRAGTRVPAAGAATS